MLRELLFIIIIMIIIIISLYFCVAEIMD